MLKEMGYQTGRIIGTPLFKKHFNLNIIGKENIPDEGPLILCGNHLHVFDQFPVICSTKRTTHWMAKKEYFDSKLGILFKATGSICVDRKNNPKASEKEAIEYLKKGSAIGMFPEGTRNKIKDEKIEKLYNLYKDSMTFETFKKSIDKNTLTSQLELLEKLYEEKRISIEEYKKAIFDVKSSLLTLERKSIISSDEYDNGMLLPFKYGAVSMAQKTNATIVPFAVTGSYVKNSKDLTVSFDKPFDVTGDLEEANEKLRTKVLQLVKENQKSR